LKTTVIIATHDRPESIRRLVASLAPELATGSREIVIAENGTPAPLQLALEGAPLKHLHDPRAGKCRIQNRAIAEAIDHSEILVFLDDDLVVATGYLASVEGFFDTHREFAAMKGRILPAEDPAKAVGPMAVYLDLPIADHGEEVIEVRGVLGANMAFRASALKQVGPFDERLGPGAAGHEEETEMSQRIRRTGFRIGYAPKALVYHEVDAGRADRDRFIRISRERGRCRMLHEKHSALDVISKNAIANVRLRIAQLAGAGEARIAREERRLAIARGMFDGLGG
jgi:GT2 family glycosyltransferase